MRCILILFLGFVACTEVETSVQAIDIEVSSKLEIDLSMTENSSSTIFKSFPVDKNSFLVFNEYGRSIDTIKLDHQGGVAIKGVEIPYEGPMGIQSMSYFQPTNQGIAFLDQQSIYLPSGNLLKRLNINDSIFGLSLPHSIPMTNVQNGHFKFLDDQSKTSFIILRSRGNSKLDKKERIELAKLDLEEKKIEKLDFVFSSKIEEHRIDFQDKGFHISSSVYPEMLVSENKVVLSYSYSNLLQIYDIESQTSTQKVPDALNYKPEKTIFTKDIPVQSRSDFFTRSRDWDYDVKFGPIMQLQNGRYFRLIRGPVTGGDKSDYYLELFDSELSKIGETVLSKNQQKYSLFYLPFGNQIFLKAFDQPDEDQLSYYIISFE